MTTVTLAMTDSSTGASRRRSRLVVFVLLSALVHGGLIAWLWQPRPRIHPPGGNTLSITLNTTSVRPRPAPAPATPHPEAARAAPAPAPQPVRHRHLLNSPRPATRPSAVRPETHRPVAAQPATTSEPASAQASTTTAKANPAETRSTPTNGSTSKAQAHIEVDESLRRALRAHFSYPMLARRRGWQGQVRLGLRVEPDGRLSHVRVLKSSGYGILDRAAMASVRAIALLPRASRWLHGQHFDMVLPVEYRLLDG